MSNVQPNYQNAILGAVETLLTSEMLSGRLTQVKAVAPCRVNEFGSAYYPYVGISIIHRKEAITATRQRQSTIDFAITLMTQSTTTLGAAYSQLYTILDDGQGNGLEAILRDDVNYNLGGLVTKAQVQEVTFFDSAMMDKSQTPSEYLAIAVLYYQTLQVILQDT